MVGSNPQIQNDENFFQHKACLIFATEKSLELSFSIEMK